MVQGCGCVYQCPRTKIYQCLLMSTCEVFMLTTNFEVILNPCRTCLESNVSKINRKHQGEIKIDNKIE